MEFLVIMTTKPDSAGPETVDEMSAREAECSRKPAAEGRLTTEVLPLTSHPSDPVGEVRVS